MGSRTLQLGLGSGLIHLKSSTWSHLSMLPGWFLSKACNETSNNEVRKGGEEILEGVFFVGGGTYVCLWNPTKTDPGAVLDNGVTSTTEINIDIGAIVHSELPTRYHDDAVLYTRDVCGPIDLPTYN